MIEIEISDFGYFIVRRNGEFLMIVPRSDYRELFDEITDDEKVNFSGEIMSGARFKEYVLNSILKFGK